MPEQLIHICVCDPTKLELLWSSAAPQHAPTRQQRRFSVVCAAAADPGTSPSRAVVVLPGLGNNSKDYERLVEQLQRRGLHTEVAQVSRLDW
jgi:alpha-beta hydrolase superfamily lysophospholipase